MRPPRNAISLLFCLGIGALQVAGLEQHELNQRLEKLNATCAEDVEALIAGWDVKLGSSTPRKPVPPFWAAEISRGGLFERQSTCGCETGQVCCQDTSGSVGCCDSGYTCCSDPDTGGAFCCRADTTCCGGKDCCEDFQTCSKGVCLNPTTTHTTTITSTISSNVGVSSTVEAITTIYATTTSIDFTLVTESNVATATEWITSTITVIAPSIVRKAIPEKTATILPEKKAAAHHQQSPPGPVTVTVLARPALDALASGLELRGVLVHRQTTSTVTVTSTRYVTAFYSSTAYVTDWTTVSSTITEVASETKTTYFNAGTTVTSTRTVEVRVAAPASGSSGSTASASASATTTGGTGGTNNNGNNGNNGGTTQGSTGLTAAQTAGVGVGAAIGALLLIGIPLFLFWKKRKQQKEPSGRDSFGGDPSQQPHLPPAAAWQGGSDNSSPPLMQANPAGAGYQYDPNHPQSPAASAWQNSSTSGSPPAGSQGYPVPAGFQNWDPVQQQQYHQQFANQPPWQNGASPPPQRESLVPQGYQQPPYQGGKTPPPRGNHSELWGGAPDVPEPTELYGGHVGPNVPQASNTPELAGGYPVPPAAAQQGGYPYGGQELDAQQRWNGQQGGNSQRPASNQYRS
ncbi:hypothetical protein B0T25DRAFT_581797 [Lasiosphaeria hispida]|uniref:Uncharacterized protein n=1 Tax=Lasiosphaeria hispida TaxID=260671 RepID=A0AAJ0HD54_9PEZI|nr:hypothetical protein B0T25DRAFT_581797 [Lasiosphaeria hispida]